MCAARFALAIAISLVGCCAADASEMPAGFVYLRDVDPSIPQDMRYATPDNFTGKPVRGYEAPQCILQRQVAEALKRAQDKARAAGYSLKVFDCYRPIRAVRAFMAWAASGDEGAKRFHPHLPKSELVPDYIAPQSAHSTGAAVDLTLVPLKRVENSLYGEVPPRQALGMTGGATAEISGGDCTAPSGSSLDMGTSFDCFDPKANTASPLASPQERKWRELLKSFLEAAGFQNYAREWWHFSYAASKDKHRFDFPIKAPAR